MIQEADLVVLSYIEQLDAVAARDWQPGDPLYPPDVSYSIPPTTCEPCPRWTPDMAPVLRFMPCDGLCVTGHVPRPRLAELMPWERRRVCTR